MLEHNYYAQNDKNSSATKLFLETLFLALKMYSAFITDVMVMNVCSVTSKKAQSSSRRVSIYIFGFDQKQ